MLITTKFKGDKERLSFLSLFILLNSFLLNLINLPLTTAWGGVGHRVIANIANIYIDKETSKKVQKYLHSMNASSIVDVANWADDYSNQAGNEWSSPCHFVDCKNNTKPEIGWVENCKTKCCAADAIKNYTSIMLEPSEPTQWYHPNQHPNIGQPSQKELSQEAFKFIIHFIGDIHQPLHVAYSDDRGGNYVDVTFQNESISLHKMWDFGLINYWQQVNNACEVKDPVWNECDGWRDLSDYVLKKKLTGTEGLKNLEKWRNSKNEWLWALETHSLVDACYDYTSTNLQVDYYYRNIDTVVEQLAKGGIRLAQYLEMATAGIDINEIPV